MSIEYKYKKFINTSADSIRCDTFPDFFRVRSSVPDSELLSRFYIPDSGVEYTGPHLVCYQVLFS